MRFPRCEASRMRAGVTVPEAQGLLLVASGPGSGLRDIRQNVQHNNKTLACLYIEKSNLKPSLIRTGSQETRSDVAVTQL